MRSGTKEGTARGQPALPEGTASPAHGGLGATIWRARQPLPRGSARVRAWRRGRPILRSNKHKYPEIIHGSGDLSDASSAAADQIRAAVNWPAAGGAGSGRRVWIPPSSLPPGLPLLLHLRRGWDRDGSVGRMGRNSGGAPRLHPGIGARRDPRDSSPPRGIRVLPPALCPG